MGGSRGVARGLVERGDAGKTDDDEGKEGEKEEEEEGRRKGREGKGGKGSKEESRAVIIHHTILPSLKLLHLQQSMTDLGGSSGMASRSGSDYDFP